MCIRDSSDAVVEGLTWACKIVDDVLIWANDVTSLHARIMEISRRAKALNVILSRKKFVIGDNLPFAGYIVSSKGVSPNQERVSAIRSLNNFNTYSIKKNIINYRNLTINGGKKLKNMLEMFSLIMN